MSNLCSALLLFFSTQLLANEETHQTHHLAVAGGVGWHESENSAFLGFAYRVDTVGIQVPGASARSLQLT